MDWQTVGTITTANSFTYTPIVIGQLFKFKHICNSNELRNLRIVIKQSFDDNGVTTFFDSKVLSCKIEQDVLLLSVPKGITQRRLGIVRVDNLLSEQWDIEIESLEVIEDGVSLPINISDVINLQQRIDEIQAELLVKALDLNLHTHTDNIANPHQVTALQVGADLAGSAVEAVVIHESTASHPVATVNSKGLLSSEDKVKIDSTAVGSTANASDSYLLNRDNHAGTQPINTVDGLQTVLDNYVTVTGNQTIDDDKIFTGSTKVASLESIGGYYYKDTPTNLEILRNILGNENDFIEVGHFFIPNGGISFRASLIVSNFNFSTAKSYTVCTAYNSTGTEWLRLMPDKFQLGTPFNDCDVDIKLAQGNTYIRARKVGNGNAIGLARIRLEFLGSTADTTFIESYVAGNNAGVVGNY